MLVFVEGGKPENPEKNPRSKARTNYRLKPHLAARVGIKFGRQALSPLGHPCSKNSIVQKQKNSEG